MLWIRNDLFRIRIKLRIFRGPESDPDLFFFVYIFVGPRWRFSPLPWDFTVLHNDPAVPQILPILFKSILEIMKGKVSREWGGLQMILLDRLEVFNFPRHGYFYSCWRFHKEFLKMAAWAVLHFNIAHQRTSTSPGTQTVLQTAKKSCGECSPKVPGSPRSSPAN